jgi:protein phosphatase
VWDLSGGEPLLIGRRAREEDAQLGAPLQLGAECRGKAMVVHGHKPITEHEWLNRTINIDTGCVYGGKPGNRKAGDFLRI